MTSLSRWRRSEQQAYDGLKMDDMTWSRCFRFTLEELSPQFHFKSPEPWSVIRFALILRRWTVKPVLWRRTSKQLKLGNWWKRTSASWRNWGACTVAHIPTSTSIHQNLTSVSEVNNVKFCWFPIVKCKNRFHFHNQLWNAYAVMSTILI